MLRYVFATGIKKKNVQCPVSLFVRQAESHRFCSSIRAIVMPWLKLLDVSFYNKIHHDEEGKQFGKNRFLQIATLKLIIQLYFLVIHGVFVGVFSPHFLHPVNSQGANSFRSPCVSTVYCLFAAATSPSTLCGLTIPEKPDTCFCSEALLST